MAKFDISREGATDLYDIWEYTLETWSENQADKYYSILTQTFSLIAEDPIKLGELYDDVYPGLYVYHIRRHMIFYMVQENGRVLIVRILHEQMDYKSHLSID